MASVHCGPTAWRSPRPVPALPRNDMELMNQRRIALPSKLTDRLLAGIVPSAPVAIDANGRATA